MRAAALMVLLFAAAPLSLSAQTHAPNAASEYTAASPWGKRSKALEFFTLGKAYHDGDGVPQSFSKARSYYLKAANLGSNDARVNLGYLYFMGEGVEQSYARARQWYLSAAREGDKPAQLNLAMIYENGLGVRKNPRKAKYWRGLAENPEAPVKVKPAPTSMPAPDSQNVTTPSAEQRAALSAPVAAMQMNPLEKPHLNYIAPSWLSSLIALTMFTLAALCAIWFTVQYRRFKKARIGRAFGNAFYASHRDSLRTSYLRYPELRRDYSTVDSPWAVAMCVLMVRFAKENGGASSAVGKQSRKTLQALKGGGFAGRQSVFPLVARLQAQIFSNIHTIDSAPKIALSPVRFQQDVTARRESKGKKRRHLHAV